MAMSVKTFPQMRAKSYESLRSSIQSGDLLLCSGTATFSKMIQRATGSVWSHVAFILRLDAIQRVMVLESVESIGVRTVPLSHYVRDYRGDGKGYPGKLLLGRHRDFANVSEKRRQRMAKFAVDHLGYPYDRDEILRIAARIGMRLFGFTAKEVKRDREYICSEYAWECYKKVRIEIPYNPAGFIAPADFARDRSVVAVAEIKVER